MAETARFQLVGNLPGVYLRPSRVDYRFLLETFSAGRIRGIKGVVSNAMHDDAPREELRAEVQASGLEFIADVRGMELATAAGFDAARRLPWAGKRAHTPALLAGDFGDVMVAEVATWLVNRHFTGVLAPTHEIASASDPWLQVDATLVRKLRAALDRAGGARIVIYYPLILRRDVFFHPVERDRIRQALHGLPIDGYWLRIHRSGAPSTGHSIRRYVRACADLHRGGLPLIGEKLGPAAFLMLAIGALAAIDTGITTGDQFDMHTMTRQKTKPAFGVPRVYVSALQSFLTIKRAHCFFSKQLAKSLYGCSGTCCPRGVDDMLENPRRHYLSAFMYDINKLNEVPESNRPLHYLQSYLRPASKMIERAAKAEPSLQRSRKRLESWTTTLEDMLFEAASFSFSPPVTGRRISVRLGA